MYADMFNRDHENVETNAKLVGGGVPVKYIVPSLQYKEETDQTGGPFANKVVPAGLVYVRIQKDPELEYENHFYPGECRSVVPDSLYDKLIETVVISRSPIPRPHHPKKQTSPKKKVSKKNSRKNKKQNI